MMSSLISFVFFFNDTATTEIYTLSLHDALPISEGGMQRGTASQSEVKEVFGSALAAQPSRPISFILYFERDRKSTRLNSSHGYISYAVFCLKKKKRPHPPEEPDRLTPSAEVGSR